MIVRNLLAVAMVCIFAVSASAQNSYSSQPNAFGGMNYYNQSGFAGSSQRRHFLPSREMLRGRDPINRVPPRS